MAQWIKYILNKNEGENLGTESESPCGLGGDGGGGHTGAWLARLAVLNDHPVGFCQVLVLPET